MDVNSLFPFSKVRDGQKEFLDDVRLVVESGRVLFAHAPTGIGKTVAAVVPALEYALKNDKVVFFLTSKQSQHKIAVDTLKLIKRVRHADLRVVDIISKQAMCPREISKEHYAVFNETCKLEQKTKKCRYFRKHDRMIKDRILSEIMHVEELKELCTAAGVCPHRTALEAAKNADVIICDYNYLFSDISGTIQDTLNLDLRDIVLIVDEAHNLPDRIRGHLSDNLTLISLREAAKEMQSIDEVMHRHLKGMERSLSKLMSDIPGEGEQDIGRDQVMEEVNTVLQETLGGYFTYNEFIEKLEDASLEEGKEPLALLNVAGFLRGWMTDLPCSRILTNRGTPRLSFRLLDPSILSGDIISGVHAAVLMSGTLYPTEMYADLLGAKPDKTLLREYTSPFPTENRLIIVTKGLTTRYAERNEGMYRKIAEKINDISTAVDGNLAVFFPSYALLESIAEYIPKKKTLSERRHMSKKQRNQLYDRLKRDGGVLLGVQAGSFSEGVDYEDNILKAVVIVGLPLSPPTLEVKNLKRYYVNKFGREKGELYSYIYPAISKVLQAGGRGIRSEIDIGVIVLMDYRFAYPTYRKCFPPDYCFEVTDKPEELCRKFFKEIIQVQRPADEERYRHGGRDGAEAAEELPLPLKILGLIGSMDGRLGRNKVADILSGSRSRHILRNQLDEHECYGILGGLPKREVVSAINELMERGYVSYGGDPVYPTIGLTEKGCAALTEKKGFRIRVLDSLKQEERKEAEGGTLDETLRLSAEGHRLEEIAEIRGLKTSTIATHLLRLVEEDRIKLDINNLVEPDVAEQVRDAVIKVGSRRLREVKDLLPPDVSYNEIRFVRASLLDKQGKEEGVEAASPQENMELFEALKAWRLKTANEKNIPPYAVFHDKTLKQLAREMPESREGLQGVYGIGAEKMRKYGDILLEIIKEGGGYEDPRAE